MTVRLEPIRKTGAHRTGDLRLSYERIVAAIGEPNVSDLDDERKVRASWGFRDADTGREAFVWCYKHDSPRACSDWSTYGDASLLREVFGQAVSP